MSALQKDLTSTKVFLVWTVHRVQIMEEDEARGKSS